jgi:hypothetical protein
MSDATLPTLRSTSSEADPRSTYSSVPNSSESDVYPFLVHSQHSIINGEPPEVDNGKLARQKRKRTRYVTMQTEHDTINLLLSFFAYNIICIYSFRSGQPADLCVIARKTKLHLKPSTSAIRNLTRQRVWRF